MKAKIKLSTRLILGFGALLAIMVLMVAVALYSMTQIKTSVDNILNVNNVKIESAHQIMDAFQQIADSIKAIMLYTDSVSLNQERSKIDTARAQFQKAYDTLLKMPVFTEEGRATRDKIGELVKIAQPLNDQMIELEQTNKHTEALALLQQQAGPATQNALDAAAQDIKINQSYNQNYSVAAANAYAASIMLLIILGLVAIAAGILITYYLTRSITKPVNNIVNALNEGANQVAAASEQLASASQQLAEGSAEQASSIEETSSTLQESASMLQQNNANTKQASQLSENTKETANKGNNEMQEMMTAISDIKKSSDQIAKIIKVIDDIAFQTNILALNAAIEAARAGEAGLGFAVVAEEVRNLAQRSAQAAKDTTTMIESNIDLSGNGVTVAVKVRDDLNEITVQTKKVSELMEEITAASQEQTQGIEQVNKAITQMETVTQENASNAEESASASEELSAQALNLREIVRQLSELVNGTNGVGLETANYTGVSHLNMQHTSQSTTKALPEHGAAARQVEGPRHNSNKMLPGGKDGFKTKVVSPEDIIPLEKDNKF
jgi:methyl-accepting chemotaxis protein